ncbi:MAG: hypothetical protein ACI9Q3_001453 [Maribacter sp.]|jgi:hypothetical protein
MLIEAHFKYFTSFIIEGIFHYQFFFELFVNNDNL